MRVDLYGVAFETPRVTVHLWSPWRSSALEHRLFDAIRTLPGMEAERGADEWRMEITDPKVWPTAVRAVERVLKGWQEEADPGSERRSWRWCLEGDTDADGYDHAGEAACLWGFVSLALERGGPEDSEREEIDLEGFGIRIWGDVMAR